CTGLFLGARWWVLRHVASRLCVGLLPGRAVGRWGGRRVGLAAYVACSACGRLADAGPGGGFLAWVACRSYRRYRSREHAMIEVENLSKRYGAKLAAGGLDFVVRPSMIAGLDAPTAGRVRVNGRDYRAAPAPMAGLGILLEARAMHAGRP